MFMTTRGRTRNDGVLAYAGQSVNVLSCREEELGDVYGLSVDFTFHNKKFDLLAVYRTHNSDLDNLTDALSNYYTNVDRGKSYIFIGDVNADLINTNNKTERYLDAMAAAGLMCGVSEPTRVAGDTRTCLDHVFINHDNYENVRTAVIQTEITDHYTVYAEIKFGTHRQTRDAPSTYIDNKLLSDLIKGSDWTAVTSEPGLNASANCFMDIISNCVNQAKKSKTVPKPRLKNLKSWITEGIVRSIRKRDKLSKRVRKQPFNVNLREYFYRYKNTLNNLIKNTKKQFYRQKLNETHNNPKRFWSVVNDLAGRGQNKDTFPLQQFSAARPELATEGDARGQVAEEFNKYFSQVGEN